MSVVLNLLCAGAAKGLVGALQGRFEDATGIALRSRFGAVGAMKDALLAGDPCDVLIVSATMTEALVASGDLRGTTRADLGRVRTGIAVRAGAPHPGIANAEALRESLLAADALYLPDPERATAGIHFVKELGALGIASQTAARMRSFANGATAMHELAQHGSPRSIGCTQVTEIRYTAGVELVGALPDRFELATVYSAAMTQRCAQPDAARRLIALLAGDASRTLRAAGGFELD
jgi:molybdate transport system substrate-binding protein